MGCNINLQEEVMKKTAALSLAILFLLVSAATVFAGEVLTVKKIAAAPGVDGVPDALWAGIPATVIKVERVPEGLVNVNKDKQKGKYAGQWAKTGYTTVAEVELKAAYTADSIFFLAKWKDATKDDKHKPFVWTGTKEAGEYKDGPQSEDRLAFEFPIKGEFDACMLTPMEATTDVWQWKAARTNPIGLIQDKWHLYSKSEPKGKFSTHYAGDGSMVYIVRPDDGNVAPYTENKVDPFVYQGDEVPKYVPTKPADADASDVAAKGVWADGFWTVEIGRKLDTGHPETDTVFGKDSQFRIAVFDHAGDHFHAGSQMVKMVYEK